MESDAYISLIGIPYQEKNCWDIAKLFYKICFNAELKHYCEGNADDREYVNNLIYTNQKDFVKVDNPKFGDIITIKIMGVECHIGIYLDSERMLHTTKATGCIIDRISRWSKLIVGYYSMNPKKE